MVHETALHQLIMDQLIILGTFLWAVRTLIYLEDFFIVYIAELLP
jgi:hypothetical protein